MVTLSPTSLKVFIQRHPVASFYILTFAISWGVLLVVVAWNGGLPSTPKQFAEQVGFAVPALLLGPSLAGILMTAIASGKAGFRELFARLLRWRVGVRWYAVALLTAPLLFVVVHTALSLFSPIFRPGLITTVDKVPFVLMGIASALLVGFCEELGWTGFAIPRLRLRYSVLATGLITGVLWAVWHVAAIRVWPGIALSGGIPVPLFMAVTSALVLVGQLPAYRVLMVWVYDRTGSLLVAMLMHVGLTFATFVLGPVVAAAGSALFVYDIALGAAWWLVVAGVLVATRGMRPLREQGENTTAIPVANEVKTAVRV
jgi:membrane protease YdiL (CAAX protease family)